MAFLEPRKIKHPHRCTMPGAAAAYAEGARWQCDTCATIWHREEIRDRGMSETAWVEQPMSAATLLNFKPAAVAHPASFYEAFTSEVDALEIGADFPAVQVVGIMTRAAKRAQMVVDRDLAPIGQRGNSGE